MKVDEFDEAFNEVPGDGKQTPAPAPAPAVVNVPAPPAPDNEPADDGEGHDDGFSNAAPAPAPAASDLAPAPAPAEDDDPVKLKHKLRTLQGIAARQGEELRTLNEERKKREATPPAPPAPPATPPAPQEPDEDDVLLAELEEASPTVAKAMRALLKKQARAMEAEIESRVGKRVEELDGQIKPLREKAEAQVLEDHFGAIESKHAQWEKTVASEQFVGWAKKQPLYVQREFARIAKEGTAAEVIEVLDSYRSTHPAHQQDNNNVDDKRAQQMAALGTISQRGTTVQTRGVDKNDFDAGFEGV